MKKFLALVLAMLMVLSLIACGKETAQEPADPGDETSTDEVTAADTVVLLLQEGGLGDQGWNDTAWAGAQWCDEQYSNIDVMHVEASGAADAELFLRELAEEGYGLVLSLDTSITNQVKAIAPDYPDTTFVIFGRYDMYTNTDNLVYLWFTLNEHAFVAGAAAAYVATDGQEIVDYAGQNPGVNLGLVFPVESNGFYRYGGGFQHGAMLTNPESNFYIDYSTGFSDVALCQTIAENMIVTNKCDVIWTCCGTSGLGGLQACRLNNALGIGVDSNQDELEPGYILTSAVRYTDQTVIDLIESWMAGTLRGSNPEYNVSNGALGITDFSTIAEYVTNEENFNNMKTYLDELRGKVAAGEVCPYDTSESVYKDNPDGGGTLVTFDEWWADNKDTNPNNTNGWHLADSLRER